MASFGFSADDVQVLHPLGPAVSIVATVNNPKSEQPDINDVLNALQGPDGNYEGIYLELRLPDGVPVLRQTTAYRTGAGRLSFAPGYDDVFGASHGGRLEPSRAGG